MKLIFVHGRAQEDFEEQKLKDDWIAAWSKGLEKSGLMIPQNLIIEFPYYGKLLKHLVEQTDKPLYNQTDVEAHRAVERSANEPEFYEFMGSFVADIAKQAATTNEEKQEVEILLNRDRSIINSEPVLDFLRFLDKKGIGNVLSLKLFTKDVYLYLKNYKIKKEVNQTIEKVMNVGEPCVVVGHSLGSIVTYLVLKKNPNFTVQKYITLGSPLGIKAIENDLDGPKEMPKCVKNGWFNAFDSLDLVALHPLDQEFFNTMPRIENKPNVKNHTDNHHGIIGYLDDAEVALKIYNALTGKN